MTTSGAIMLGTHLAALSAGWQGSTSATAMRAAADEASALGYRLLETPLFDPLQTPTPHSPTLAKVAEHWAYTALPPSLHLPQRPEHARIWLGRALAWCETADVRVLGGALGWSPGVDLDPHEIEWKHSLLVEVLRDCAVEAQRRGVTLALEPANRYETNLCNTLAQGVELLRAIDMPNVRLLGNTFHMHLEEGHLGAALRNAGEWLIGLHLAENTGGKLGSGGVAWESIWRSLGEMRFSGALIVAPWNQAALRACQPEATSAASDALRFLRGAFRSMEFANGVRTPGAVASPVSSPDSGPPADAKPVRKRKRSTTKSYRTR